MKYIISLALMLPLGSSVWANQYIAGVTVGRFPTTQYIQPPMQMPQPFYNPRQPIYIQPTGYQYQNQCMNYCCECCQNQATLPYRQIRIQEVTEPVIPY